MNAIVQWATILSPIIAVLIAWWMSRSSAKDTAKQIGAQNESTAKQLAAQNESTSKQVEAMIKVAKTQIELSKIQLEVELWDAENKFNQKMDESKYAGERQRSMIGVPMNEFTMHINAEREKEDKLSSELTYFTKRKLVIGILKDRIEAVDILLNKK